MVSNRFVIARNVPAAAPAPAFIALAPATLQSLQAMTAAAPSAPAPMIAVLPMMTWWGNPMVAAFYQEAHRRALAIVQAQQAAVGRETTRFATARNTRA